MQTTKENPVEMMSSLTEMMTSSLSVTEEFHRNLRNEKESATASQEEVRAEKNWSQ